MKFLHLCKISLRCIENTKSDFLPQTVRSYISSAILQVSPSNRFFPLLIVIFSLCSFKLILPGVEIKKIDQRFRWCQYFTSNMLLVLILRKNLIVFTLDKSRKSESMEMFFFFSWNIFVIIVWQYETCWRYFKFSCWWKTGL